MCSTAAHAAVRRSIFSPNILPKSSTNITVNAGSDQALTNVNGQLIGTVSPTVNVTTLWTQSSGPSAIIVTPGALATDVTYSGTGTYVFRLTATDGVLTAFDTLSVVVTVNTPPANNPPTVSQVATQNGTEDTVRGPIAVTVGDDITAPGALTVLAVSSNPALVPNANIALGGSGANRTVTLTPVANASGQTTITVSATDGGNLTTTMSFAANFSAVNDSPQFLTTVPGQDVGEDAVTGPLSFSIQDQETSATFLTLSGFAANSSLVAASGITFGGTGASRNVTIRPVANANGNTTITIVLSDGSSTTQMNFAYNIQPVNDPPMIGKIPNIQTTNGVAGSSGFTVGDIETSAGTLTLTATTSNPAVAPVSSISFGGSGANRTVTVTPIAAGSAVIGVTVSDGSATAGTSFTVTSGSGNTPPEITAPFDQVISEDEALAATEFAIADAETDPSLLTVTADSSDPSIVPSSGITLGGSGANRTIAITPTANANGSVIITLSVFDSGGLSDTAAFTLTVNPVNDSPTISQSPSQNTPEDTAKVVNFSVDDRETAAGSLTVTKSSSNQTLVPDANIVLGGSGANRTATITPGLDQTGSCTISLVVSDGSLTATNSFLFVVAAVNDPPTISAISNQTVNEDTPTSALPFTIGDTETPADSLTLSKNSSDATKIPLANIVFGGSGSSRTVTVTPAVNQNGGPVTITVAVSDGTNSTATTFTVTITGVNDPPTITSVPNQTIPRDSSVAVNVTVSDVETGAGALTMGSTSSNPGLLPTSNITWSGGGSVKTATLTPVAGQTGTATVTLTVSDGTATVATPSFTVTVVNPVNTAPTISDIGNVTIAKNSSTGPLSFTISDAETPTSGLVLSVTSSNPSLVSTNQGAADGTVTRYYVSPSGSDSNDGLAPTQVSGTQGPFATIEKARDVIRTLSAGQFPSTGLTVLIRGGQYFKSTSIDFTSADSGRSSTAPVVYRNYPGEVPQFVGGKEVTGWAAVSGAVLARLNPAQEAAIKQASLSALGITLGTFNPYGRFSGVITVPIQQAELSFQGLPMTVARYPNQTTLTDGSKFALTVSPTSGNTFTYTGTRPSGWAETVSNIRVGGWFGPDFSDNTINVSAINTGSKLVTLAASTGYPIASGDRYYFENVLEELDQAGEYCIDPSTSIAYVWPPAAIGGANKVFASQVTTQIISVNGASDLRFDGLVIESSRFKGVQITGGTRVVLRNCTIRNTGGEAVNINSTSRSSGLEYCEVSGTGGSGVVLDGGIRTSLTRGDNYVSNSRLFNFSRLVKAYVPAVEPRGVGQLISHNVISNAPAQAIYLTGNDHVMEYNYIHHVCLEAGDLGAYYQWGDPTERGNIIRYNFITDVTVLNGASPILPVHGLYMDGNSCGVSAYGNILHRMFSPILNNGGRDNVWSNNVLGEITLPNWQRIWLNSPSPPPEYVGYYNAMPTSSSPWLKYPHLSNLMGDEYTVTKYVVISRNIKHGQGNFTYYETGVTQGAPYVTETQNYTGGSPGFVNYSLGSSNPTDFDLTSGSPAWALGWTRIPSEQIGVQPQVSSGISFGGSGGSRTITVTPIAGQTGSSTITVMVTDAGGLTASDAFTVTVSDSNNPPTFSGLTSQTVAEDVPKSFSFTVADDTTPAANITVTAISSNTGLVPNGNIAIATSGATRTVTVTPAANQNGSTTITFTASDGSASSVQSITFTVTAVNDAPTISAIQDQSTATSTPVTVTGIAVADVETPAGSLTMSALSGNTALISNSGFSFGGSGGTRTCTITPVTGQTGTASVTITVNDGTGGTASRTFNVTVGASGTQYWVSPTGDSMNSGTSPSSPWTLVYSMSFGAPLDPGDLVWVMPGNYVGQQAPVHVGTLAQPITWRGTVYPNDQAHAVLDMQDDRDADGPAEPCIKPTSSARYLIFQDLELRNSVRSRIPSNQIREALYHDKWGSGSELRNCVLRDGGNNIVVDAVASGQGAIIYGNISIFAGWRDTGSGTYGNECYAQNRNGLFQFRENIMANDFVRNFQLQGTDEAFTWNTQFTGNVGFSPGALGGSHGVAGVFGFAAHLSNVVISANYTFDNPLNAAGGSLNAGSMCGTCDTSHFNVTYQSNYVVAPLSVMRNLQSSSVRFNTFIAGIYDCVDFSDSQTVSLTMDNNFYRNSAGPTIWRRNNGSSLNLAQVQALGYESAGTFSGSLPVSTKIDLRKNGKDPRLAHLIIYNWNSLSQVSVSLSTDIYGQAYLSNGDSFKIIPATNPFVVWVSGVYNGSVSIPMNGFPQLTPAGASDTRVAGPRSPEPLFGAFKVIKTN